MDENPYQSPTFVEPQPPGRRPMRVAGTMMIVLGLLVWLPMTIGCFVMAATHPELDLWIKLAAGVFNGAIATLLVWGGRKLFVGGQKKIEVPDREVDIRVPH